MKKYLSLIVFSLVLSCTQESDKFCNCLEKSESFNKATNEYLESGESVSEKALNLKKEMREACKDYETMSGEKMLELKSDCK